MKKFFRLVSVFAIAGVTFAYTSCTDYSEDIEVANGRITTLEGSVATLQSQVTSLQSAVSSLQTALTTAQGNITALQNQLSALETKHDQDIAALETAYKNADAALKKALEDQIKALQDKHNQDVTKINQDIAALQNLCTSLGNRITSLEQFKAQCEAILPTLATKTELAALQTQVNDFEAWVKATLATKEEVAALETQLNNFKAYANETFATKAELEAAKAWVVANFATKTEMAHALELIGGLDGRLSIVEEDLESLQTETIPDIYTKIKAAHDAADAAQATATEALGKVDALIEALGVYAEKGKLEETIVALIEKDSLLNDEILKLIAQDEAFKVDIKNLQDKDKVHTALIDSLAARGLFYDAAIEALKAKDAEHDSIATAHKAQIEELYDIKLNIADFQTYFDNALTEAVKDNGIVGKVIIQKVEAAKTFLLGKIDELRTEVMTEIAKINGIFPERLTSIVFVPQYYVDGIDAIVFETLAYNGMKTGAAAENDVPKEDQSGLVSKYNFNVSAETTAKYRFSPKTVGIDCADWDFVGNVAETRVVAPEAPIQIVGAPKYDEKTGEAVFTVEKKENVKFQEGNKVDIVALKATLKKGLTDAEKVAEEKPVVFSEYERVVEDIIYAKDLAISDSTALVTKSAKYPTVAHADWKALKIHEFTKTFQTAVAGPVVYKMNYDQDFDLGELVATCVNKKGVHSQLDLAKFGLYYKFSVAENKYEITTDQTTTNQQTNIKCVDAVNGIYRTTGKYADGTETEYNKESIGRTPIVKIELMHGEQVVTRAFVKIEIVVVHEPDILVVNDAENYVYGSAGCGKEHKLVIDVERMRAQVYRVCNISHEEFWNTYEVESTVVTKNGKACSVTPPTVISGTTSAGVATKEIVWIFNDSEVGEIGKGAKLLATIKLHNKLFNSSTYPEYVTFTFEFNYTLPDYSAFVDVVKKDIFWDEDVLQANVNRPESITDVAANCWFNTPIEVQPWQKFVIDANGKGCIAEKEFVIVNVFENGKKIAYDKSSKGVYLTTYPLNDPDGEVSIALNKQDEAVKVALNSEKGLQAEVAYVATLESGDEITLFTFLVNFIRPLTLNMPEGLSVQDAKTGGDVIDFDFEGLLVDWRGELVLPPSWSYEPMSREWFFWKKVCSPAEHALVVPGYQKIVTPAYWEIEFEDVTIPLLSTETYTLYTFKHSYRFNEALQNWYMDYGTAPEVWVNIITGSYRTTPPPPRQAQNYYHYTRIDGTWEEGYVTGQGRSAEEAEQNALAELDAIGAYFRNGEDLDGCVYPRDEEGELTSEEISGLTTTEVTFKNMVSATYYPEEYEDVPAEIVYSDCSEEPTNIPFEDLKEGDRVGCYQWTKASIEWNQPIWNAGQYWFFYGPISANVVLDTDPDSVTTSLPDKKLPAGASLVQTGNTLKYENVLSPIQYPYYIYIPATVEYGWGVLNSTMTIKVNPVSTIYSGE